MGRGTGGERVLDCSMCWYMLRPCSLVRPSRFSSLRFAMNIRLALAGQQLISTYGCGHMLFKKLQPIRLNNLVTLLFCSLLPNPVGSKKIFSNEKSLSC